MRNRLLTLIAVLSLIGSISATALPGVGVAAPVKCAPNDVTADGRVFPEPRYSATFLSLADFECGIGVLNQTNPDRVDIEVLGRSASDHPIYNIRVTNEAIDESQKQHLLIMSSIHGNEHAGREGGARVIEDMVDARYMGSQQFVKDTLDKFVVHFVFPNPDGWVNGVITGENRAGVNFSRSNNGGRDLNRNFPVQGYLRASNGTLDQPEGRALSALLDRYSDLEHDVDDPDYRGWQLGTDNHGQGAKPVAASGLQIVGQFDFQKSERLANFADSIADEMEGEALTAIETLNQATGGAIEPYEWGTLYDILGYSAAGSGIDYYNSPQTLEANAHGSFGVGGTGFATEMTASNLPFSNILTHPGEVNQMWVETVRAINFAMFKAAVASPEFTFPVGGKAAYVMDPNRTTSLDGFGAGNAEMPSNFTGFDDKSQYTPYSVSRMDFYADLNNYASEDLDAITVEGIVNGTISLGAYDSIVISDMVTPKGQEALAGALADALTAYASAGGNVVLTDSAVGLLPAMFDGISASDVSKISENVGNVRTFTDRGHHLNEGLRGIASQTYDVIPIGMPDGGRAAPNWLVRQAAWDADGGFTAGTSGTGQTIYGEKPLGEGKVSFLGALLPEPTEEFFHPYGLQDYAVTYTGYSLLQNMLDHAR